MSRDNPLRQIPRLYGTDLGLRDEVLVHLGLAGMRSAEILHLRMCDLHLGDGDPYIAWIGKKRRARRVVPSGGTFCMAFDASPAM